MNTQDEVLFQKFLSELSDRALLSFHSLAARGNTGAHHMRIMACVEIELKKRIETLPEIKSER